MPRSLAWLVIGRAARDGELPVPVIDDHEAPGSDSELLSQPPLNDDFQELAVYLANLSGKWREDSPARFEWDQDGELAIDQFDESLERDNFSHTLAVHYAVVGILGLGHAFWF